MQNNQANNVSGRYMINGCMAGKFHDTDILLFDDNMDGLYTQDGKDAIAIGGSAGAMPLRNHHQIGKNFYSLEVKSDGSEITFQREEDLDLGVADVPVAAALVRYFLLDDDAARRAYDLKVSGATGIPAGKYKLSMPVLAAGNRFVVAGPTAMSHTYAVLKDVMNILRFGGDIRLHFGALLLRAGPADSRAVHHRAVRGGRGEVQHGLRGLPPAGGEPQRDVRRRSRQSADQRAHDLRRRQRAARNTPTGCRRVSRRRRARSYWFASCRSWARPPACCRWRRCWTIGQIDQNSPTPRSPPPSPASCRKAR